MACARYDQALALWRVSRCGYRPLRGHPAVAGLARRGRPRWRSTPRWPPVGLARPGAGIVCVRWRRGAAERAGPRAPDDRTGRERPAGRGARGLRRPPAPPGRPARRLAGRRTRRGARPCAAPAHPRAAAEPGAGEDPGASAARIPPPASRASPARASPVVPRQLPAAASHFVGRAAELAALTGLLGQVRARRRDGGDLGHRRYRRSRQDHPGGALGASGRRPVPRRPALREPARVRPGGQPAEPAEALRGFLDAFASRRRGCRRPEPGPGCTAACWPAAGCWWCWTTPATTPRCGRCCPAAGAAPW